MPHSSRRKGFDFERAIVREAQAAGLRAVRGRGSDGRTLVTDTGEVCTSGVDVLIEGTLRVQCKRRKQLPAYITPPDGADITVLRADRQEALAVIPLSMLFELLHKQTR